jgi:hypothetical protein
MTTIAAIAAKALNGVAAKITDAVQVATLTRTAQGAYDPQTGSMVKTNTTTTGRLVYCNAATVKDIFPGYTVGPSDQLLLLEGFTSVQKNDLVNGLTVHEVQDIGGAGSVFYAVAR